MFFHLPKRVCSCFTCKYTASCCFCPNMSAIQLSKSQFIGQAKISVFNTLLYFYMNQCSAFDLSFVLFHTLSMYREGVLFLLTSHKKSSHENVSSQEFMHIL